MNRPDFIASMEGRRVSVEVESRRALLQALPSWRSRPAHRAITPRVGAISVAKLARASVIFEPQATSFDPLGQLG